MNVMKNRTIVFVEDDAIVRKVYQNRLQQQGFDVQVAEDGLEAMKMLSMSAPDLIILDLMLPKFNGVEVMRFIRAKSHLKTVPVIILSTNSVIDVDEEYLLEQANKRLIKDHCTPALMIDAIQEVLNSPLMFAPAPSHAFAAPLPAVNKFAVA